MKKVCFTLPAIEQVEFTLTAEQDDIPVRGNAMASGDNAVDKAYEDEILRRLDNGDTWAWASVKVTASYKGYKGCDYLGCCSYEDEADFKEPGGHYEDMKNQAYDELYAKLQALAD